MTIDLDRLEKANKVLATYEASVRLIVKSRRIAVEWYQSWNSTTVSKVWIPMRGSDHYPTWHKQMPFGGTSSTAISQLIRWVKHQPVLGLSTWLHWASENVRLCTPETINVLKDVGYQEKQICVLCNQEAVGLDWWHLGKVSGPCCGRGGCRDKKGDAK